MKLQGVLWKLFCSISNHLEAFREVTEQGHSTTLQPLTAVCSYPTSAGSERLAGQHPAEPAACWGSKDCHRLLKVPPDSVKPCHNQRVSWAFGTDLSVLTKAHTWGIAHSFSSSPCVFCSLFYRSLGMVGMLQKVLQGRTSEKTANIFGFHTKNESWPSIRAGLLHSKINFPFPGGRIIDAHGEDQSLEKTCAALGLTEVIFCTVAGMELCFGFVLNTGLITQRLFVIAEQGLHRGKAFSAVCRPRWWGSCGRTGSWGYNPGQLTKGSSMLSGITLSI